MVITDQDLQYFVTTLKNSSKYDFSEYSDKSLKRRLQKVLTDFNLDITGLISAIKNKPEFTEKIVKEITVNTTELFRDPQVWHTLRSRILPRFKNNKNINIWHAGCSTGQEVYSMMILLNEMGMLDKAKIFASDLNSDVLEAAKKGEYKYRFNIAYLDNFDKVIKQNPLNYEEFNDVPYETYFDIDKSRDTITMKKYLTEKPIFRKHDLVKDGNLFFAKFDLILCRNVIIYFNYTLQNKVFDLFHSNLYNKGILLLGMHETILGPWANKFEKMGQAYIKK
ncbi:MAG: CheR family methyltransferase [Tenuifilaceae bacterium]|jgi:chemotaxis protein methyltransferase CheR|uniref:CheR family methyltransferase n=1 Tax=Perlabentimonas gracilis TaxID=2715279 RepID=UPI001408B1D1|nr:CheR family methyltransferase [Perlabentimonas gracilis]MDX9769958.1 CheR family methyltransferase [Tenuifilaceae bacterium]NHB67602.1 protein-glutamate O-methyltransferase CheR [Perlabentimonas gracilis]